MAKQRLGLTTRLRVLTLTGFKNTLRWIIVTLTPIGLGMAITQAWYLFHKRWLKYLKKPIWILILSNALVSEIMLHKRKLYLLRPLFGKVKILLIPDLDSIWLFGHIYICNDYNKIYELRKNDLVLDVGANVGIYTLKCLQSVSYVISIEPDPLNVQILHYNLKLNNLHDKCKVVQVAAGDKMEKRYLYLNSCCMRHSLLPDYPTLKKIIVECIPLSQLVNNLKLQHVDFVKIDVEGYELNVLRGMTEIIRRFNPILIVELKNQSTSSEIIALLKAYKTY